MFVRQKLCRWFSLSLVGAALLVGAVSRPAGATELFYNFYAGPESNPPGQPVQMYISPRPVPPLVGHTYITYQPFMAHEMLYQHKRTYYRFHPDGGHTVTHIKWDRRWW